MDQRRRQVEPAAHPTRVRAHRPISGVGQVELLEQLAEAAAHDPVGQVRQQPDETQVLRPVRFSSTAANWPARPMDCARPGDRPRRRHRARQPARRPRRSTVVRIRTAVVLPAPLAQQPEDPARRHGEVDTPERHHLAEPLLQPLDQDRIISHSASVPPCAMRVHAPRPGSRDEPDGSGQRTTKPCSPVDGSSTTTTSVTRALRADTHPGDEGLDGGVALQAGFDRAVA